MFHTSPKRSETTFLTASLVSRVYFMKLDIKIRRLQQDIKARCLLKEIAYLGIALQGTILILSMVRIVFTTSDTNYLDIPCHTYTGCPKKCTNRTKS